MLVEYFWSPRVEVAERGMHRSRSGDVSREMTNLESAVQREVHDFYSKLGKVAVMSLDVARGKELIR